jgi:hypothetical protein
MFGGHSNTRLNRTGYFANSLVYGTHETFGHRRDTHAQKHDGQEDEGGAGRL